MPEDVFRQLDGLRPEDTKTFKTKLDMVGNKDPADYQPVDMTVTVKALHAFEMPDLDETGCNTIRSGCKTVEELRKRLVSEASAKRTEIRN